MAEIGYAPIDNEFGKPWVNTCSGPGFEQFHIYRTREEAEKVNKPNSTVRRVRIEVIEEDEADV